MPMQRPPVPRSYTPGLSWGYQSSGLPTCNCCGRLSLIRLDTDPVVDGGSLREPGVSCRCHLSGSRLNSHTVSNGALMITSCLERKGGLMWLKEFFHDMGTHQKLL